MEKNRIFKKLMERHQREWKKCLNPDSNRGPPAHAADCSTVELLRPRPNSRARGHLNHLASALGPPHRRDLRFFSAPPTGPPRSDPLTRAAKEDIN